MLKCWHEYPGDRPNFVQLRAQFDRMLSKQKNAEELYIFIQADEPPLEAIDSEVKEAKLAEKPELPQSDTGDENRPENPYVDQPALRELPHRHSHHEHYHSQQDLAVPVSDPNHTLSRSFGDTSTNGHLSSN